MPDSSNTCAQRPDGKPGRVWPCGQKVFSVLTFWFFCVKTKEVAPAAMSGENTSFKRKTSLLRNEA